MKGVKDFLMRGNLVEIAVGLIIATAFAAVVTAFTELLTAVISKLFGGPPEIGSITIAEINVGPFINAVIAFIMMAAIVYFGIIKPLAAMQNLRKKEEAEEAAAPTSEELLTEIRDLLKAQSKN